MKTNVDSEKSFAHHEGPSGYKREERGGQSAKAGNFALKSEGLLFL